MEISPMAEVPSRPCGGDFPGFNMFQWGKWWENMGENRENMGKMVNILAKWWNIWNNYGNKHNIEIIQQEKKKK